MVIAIGRKRSQGRTGSSQHRTDKWGFMATEQGVGRSVMESHEEVAWGGGFLPDGPNRILALDRSVGG